MNPEPTSVVPVDRVLVVRFGALGDMVLLTTMI